MHPSRSILSRRLLGAGVAAVVLAAASTTPATAAGGDDPPEQATGWYLALGDSLATGYQPDRGEDRSGGYVGPVLDGIRAEHPKTKLVNLPCYGESTVTMRDGTHCSGAYEEGSQLAEAVEFLHAHRRTTRLVTVTLGSNDVTPCLSTADVRACAERQLLVVDHSMRFILGALHDTAPDVPIVVTNYYNPYLALFFDPSRRALVPLTSALQAQLNTTLFNATVAATGGEGRVADVATAFNSYDGASTGGVPRNVATVCAYTWMCSWSPPNIHATSLGYDAMAAAVLDRL